MTQSGLYIRGREFPQIATVLALGNGRRNSHGERIPIRDLQVGDMVKFQTDNPDGTFKLGSFIDDERLILDYEQCQLGMRMVDGKMRIWPLERWCVVRRQDTAPTDSP